MTFVFIVLTWILSLCLHEYSHARVAYSGGDTSVKEKGYLSLNPFYYMEPMYSIIMPLVFLLLGGIGLPGGAVYVETSRLKNRGWETAVSAAGPASNLIIAVVIALIFRFGPVEETVFWAALAFLGLLQATSFILNILPIPPLDGFGIIAPYLSEETRYKVRSMGSTPLWGIFLLLWYVQPVSEVFWKVVHAFTDFLGIPSDLAWQGYINFKFW